MTDKGRWVMFILGLIAMGAGIAICDVEEWPGWIRFLAGLPFLSLGVLLVAAVVGDLIDPYNGRGPL